MHAFTEPDPTSSVSGTGEALARGKLLRFVRFSVMATLDGPAGNLRKRKSASALQSDGITNGTSTAMLRVNGHPTEHGREIDRKMDEHQSLVSSAILHQSFRS